MHDRSQTMKQFHPFFQVGFRISPVTLELHAGPFTCLATYRTRSEEYTINLRVLMKNSYVPPPHINRTLARHVHLGVDIDLLCSVTVDFGVMVELSWTTPNKKALNENRVIASELASRNLSLGGTHLKTVQQVKMSNSIDGKFI